MGERQNTSAALGGRRLVCHHYHRSSEEDDQRPLLGCETKRLDGIKRNVYASQLLRSLNRRYPTFLAFVSETEHIGGTRRLHY